MLQHVQKNWEAPKHTGGVNALQKGEEFQIWPSYSLGAVGRCEEEGKVHHSFNICPKALHGSPKQCYNVRGRIGKHQNIQEE